MPSASRAAARLLASALALAGLILPLPPRAAAQDAAPARVGFEIHVLEASPTKGAIDPGARRFHALLGKQVRYESLRLLDTQQRRVAVGDIGRVKLPTGTVFRFRPLDVGGRGVLVAVDMGRTAKGDFRIPKGKPLVIGGQPYRDGQLVVILEARD